MDGFTIRFGLGTEVSKLTVTDIQTYVLDRRRQNLTHLDFNGFVNGILNNWLIRKTPEIQMRFRTHRIHTF